MRDREFEVLYLVYGVFWQDFAAIMHAEERQSLDKRTVNQPNPERYPFWGAIGTEKDGHLVGALLDVWGESILTEIQITDTNLSFVKAYTSWLRDPTEVIHYSFEKKGALWSGSYSSPGVGTNRAMCVLYGVQADLFQFQT